MGAPDRSSAWAISRAWWSLPRRTRRELVLAAVKGRRPRTDLPTWRTTLAWAELYPALAIPQVLMALCFLYLAGRGIYDQFGWLVGTFACYLLVAAAWTTFATSRIRRSAGPVDPGQSPDRRADTVTP
ncbi:hypothetical protein LJR027_003772 [Terrabacter sp. LjRoot27]|uniref:hypothetical protein n=1 Tax=Terrabacter sp. LjRoot27 TaxID=3342306 RepID=UPI003ECFC097